jgi:hypothetical protein
MARVDRTVVQGPIAEKIPDGKSVMQTSSSLNREPPARGVNPPVLNGIYSKWGGDPGAANLQPGFTTEVYSVVQKRLMQVYQILLYVLRKHRSVDFASVFARSFVVTKLARVKRPRHGAPR